MQYKDAKVRVSGRFWLERGERSFLGHGRIELLERIAEAGSIAQAARAMGMSYKAAWDAVDAMNNISDLPLVQRNTGGRNGGGTRLTDQGHKLIQVYKAAEQEYRRFLRRLSNGIEDFDHFYQLMRTLAMKTSARNEFRGRVSQLTADPVNAEVLINLPGGGELAAVITNESLKNLALSVGSDVIALIKASWVILATAEEPTRTSARNRLCGTVVAVREGPVNCEVVLELSGGKTIAAVVTQESTKTLDLRVGVPACALIKASHVILAVTE